MRVVSHNPLHRLAKIAGVALLCLLGIWGGYKSGGMKAELDMTYLESLESIKRANAAEIRDLRDSLVASGLAREVDQQTAQELRRSIETLHGDIASLSDEVTFYKSLMAPSSLLRGLQIAEFTLAPTEHADQFTFHLLLTQVETRRDWIQGSVQLAVYGRDEQVLSLTEIAAGDTYPLQFRFRYFQDLSGVITLPADFEPESVIVTARRRGANTADLSKTFAWIMLGAGGKGV